MVGWQLSDNRVRPRPHWNQLRTGPRLLRVRATSLAVKRDFVSVRGEFSLVAPWRASRPVVMDWWGEGRGARPLVVRDMSSGARIKDLCVGGPEREPGAQRALACARGEALEQKNDPLPKSKAFGQ